MLSIDGLAQAAGAGMLIGGIAAPRTVLIRNEVGLNLVPMPITFGTKGAGVGFNGSF